MLGSIHQIQAGMVVKLKGSIMPMSVNSIEGNIADCYWFDGRALNKADFNIQDLVIHQPEINVTPVLAGGNVILRSGGPVMHVERIEFRKNKPHAICAWQFNNNHYLKKFNSAALQNVGD
jgi:uncharacterized protein YodC (DUF2158 family)